MTKTFTRKSNVTVPTTKNRVLPPPGHRKVRMPKPNGSRGTSTTGKSSTGRPSSSERDSDSRKHSSGVSKQSDRGSSSKSTTDIGRYEAHQVSDLPGEDPISPAQQELLDRFAEFGHFGVSRDTHINDPSLGVKVTVAARKHNGDVYPGGGTADIKYSSGVVYHQNVQHLIQYLEGRTDGLMILNALRRRVKLPDEGEVSIPLMDLLDSFSEVALVPQSFEAIKQYENSATTVVKACGQLRQLAQRDESLAPALVSLAQVERERVNSWSRQRKLVDFLKPLIWISRRHPQESTLVALKLLDVEQLGGHHLNRPWLEAHNIVLDTIERVIARAEKQYPNFKKAPPQSLPPTGISPE